MGSFSALATVVTCAGASADVRDATAAHDAPAEYRRLIYGSTPTAPRRHPYMAALVSIGPGGDSLDRHPFCAGVLVAPDAVLSAAHCVDDKDRQRLDRVVVGRHARIVPRPQEDEDSDNDNEDSDNDDDNDNDTIFHLPEPAEEEFEVADIIHHPYHDNGFNYINDHLLHDVVIIRLKGISKHRPIDMNFDESLPTWNEEKDESHNNNGEDNNNQYTAGQLLTVLGWGSVNSAKDKPDYLRQATLHYVPNDVCEASAGEINGRQREYAGYITEDMMCAAAPGRDSCGGDSGGPLIIEGGTSDGSDGSDGDLLVGLVSWGYGCADPNFPGVYSRLSAHRDWIVRELCSDTSLGPRRYPQWCSAVGDIPTHPPTEVPPTPAPTATPKCLDLRLEFDNFPEELGWSIQPVDFGNGSSKDGDDDNDDDDDAAAGSVITRVPGYYRDKKGQVVKERVCLADSSANNNKYTFAIVDKRGDGMMSGKQGSYALFDADDGKLLARGGGNFQLVKMETLDIGLMSDATDKTMEERQREDGSTIILVRPGEEEETDNGKRVDGANVNNNIDRSGSAAGTATSMLAFSMVVSAVVAVVSSF